MEIFLLVIHILISVALVLIILAQTSQGSGLDSNLGGAAANVFGSSASDMLKKWTKIIGGLFLISCVFLAITVKTRNSGSAGLASSIKVESSQEEGANQLEFNDGDVQEVPISEPASEATSETPER